MNTSYFAKSAKNSNSVSIAAKAPDWYNGREYKKLVPKYWFLNKFKEDGDEKFYIKQYQKEVLSILDARQVYDELGENAVLLCWEKSGKFCHRHLVSNWFKEKLGIEVKEL
jgi:uncharacterized protein (DUF488 family)